MNWIRRNRFAVLGGTVAVGMLGLASGYLGVKIQKNRAVTSELNLATKKLEGLARRDPYPNLENINAANAEAQRAERFLRDLKGHFVAAPYPEPLDNRALRAYLDTTRAALLRDAERAGVDVPPNYWFTFGAQKGLMSFSPGTLQPLAAQLGDIRAICEVLFDAKVNSLVWLKRVTVDSQDSMGSQDYLSGKAVTNNGAILTPYEVTFEGFSTQLAAVLERLARLPQGFVVSNLIVEPTGKALAPANPALPGRHNRFWGREVPMVSIPDLPRIWRPTVSSGATVILDQQLLRFTLALQSAKAQNM